LLKNIPISHQDLVSSKLESPNANLNPMKKAHYYLWAFTLMILFAATQPSIAQMQTPVASPAGHVSQIVGFTKISMDYSSPAVKGRKVFGELQKFGEPWRAGANAPTTIEFSTAVNIQGTDLGPGKYTVFITPQESGDWTIHINSKGNAIYAYMVDEKVDAAALGKDDAVAIKATPTKTVQKKERLTYSISAEDNKVAEVTMEWDTVQLSFLVDTQVDQKIESFKSAF
jgi:hypothetical protein